jgi:TonB family protein
MKTLVAPVTKISLHRASIVGAGAVLLFIAAFNAPTPASGSESTNDAGSTFSIEAVETIKTVEAIDGPGESSIPPTVVTSDTLDASAPEAAVRVPSSVCMRGPDGDTGCTEISGSPDSHVVCSTDNFGTWGCVEVPGARASAQVCVVAPGMNLCADSTITYRALGPEIVVIGYASQARELPSGVVAPQGATPQDVSAPSSPVPFEVEPGVRNLNEVNAALVREYPTELRNQRIGGRVLLNVFIDETGVVRECRIVSSSGYAPLDGAALRVCPVYKFVPARTNGRAVPAWLRIPISFQAR